MTLYGEPRVWLEQFPMGEATPLTRDHQGLRYPREVIRADKWSANWGQPLDGEVFFRIVLLRQRRGGLRPALRDPRVALCLPGAGLSRRRGRLAGELATTRETQAIYLTHRDAEADLIRRTLRRHQESMEEQILGEESVRYSEGEVLTGGVLEGHADQRLDDFLRIVQASDLSALSNTLTPELLTFIRRMLG